MHDLPIHVLIYIVYSFDAYFFYLLSCVCNCDGVLTYVLALCCAFNKVRCARRGSGMGELEAPPSYKLARG